MPPSNTASAAAAHLRQARAQARAGFQSSPRPGTQPGAVRLEDLYAYMVMHNYIFAPTGDLWPAASVNARIAPIVLRDYHGNPVLDADGNPVKVKAAAWLDQNKPVEQMTWAPGELTVVRDRLITEGGWIERKGAAVFNRYRPPLIEPGNAALAQRWLDHIDKVYRDDTDHIVKWCAQRVQQPHIKINHALVFGGLQGIGKDTLLEPVKRAVGPWNVAEVNPQQLLDRFNGFVRSIILRVSEARDLGEVNRYHLYEHLKAYTAAPPDVLLCDEKNTKAYNVLNCCGVVLTTNHKAGGIYLPEDDRRHYVAWSERTKDDFVSDYWTSIWRWYDDGGDRHVAAYLAEYKLSKFDPKAPPPKTAAFWAIVDANRAPEAGELADVLDKLAKGIPPEWPDAVTLLQVLNKATGSFSEWLEDRRNRRTIPHRFEQCGYVPVRNDAAKDGLWVINKVRQVIYAKAALSPAQRLDAAQKL